MSNKLNYERLTTSITAKSKEINKPNTLAEWQIRKILDNQKHFNIKRLQANIANRKSPKMPSPQTNSSKNRNKKDKGVTEENHVGGQNKEQAEINIMMFNKIEETKKEIIELKKLVKEKEKALMEMSERNRTLEKINIETRNRFSCLDTSNEGTENMDIEAKKRKTGPDQDGAKDNKKTTKDIENINMEVNINTRKRVAIEEISTNKRGTGPDQDRTKHTKKVRDVDGTFVTTLGHNVKEGRPPPINIYNQDPKNIIKVINNNIKDAKFHIKRVNDLKQVLYIDTANRKKITDILSKNSFNFYSYTKKDEKVQTWLLKGLNPIYSKEKILQELKTLENKEISFTRVSRFSIRESTRQEKTLPIFVVQLSPDSNPAILKTIKFVAHQVITWEKLNRKEIIQCRR